MSIRTRFAPSPTGYLHIGGVRTALFNWLLAKRHGGQWILRIDDTDAERNRPEALQPILDGFRWLGMQWDEGPEVGGPCGPYYQSQKLERYKEMAMKLVATGHAYPDLSSKEELDVARKAAEKAKQPYVHRGPNRDASPEESLRILQERQLPIRMKVPLGKVIAIDDLIRGHVEWQADLIGDPVILRADGRALYNFATVIDDVDLKITHVIRAEEHLSNTCVQAVAYEALGMQLPKFAHVPVVLEPAPSKKKLSKRDMKKFVTDEIKDKLRSIGWTDEQIDSRDDLNPATVAFYKEMGYLPTAIVNYLGRLGWSLDDKTEFMTVEQMIANFGLDRVKDSPAGFDLKKLYWLAGEHMQLLPMEEKINGVLPYLVRAKLVTEPVDEAIRAKVRRVVEACGDRIKLFSDILTYGSYFFRKDPVFDKDALKKRVQKEGTPDLLRKTAAMLQATEPFDHDTLEKAIHAFCEQNGVKLGDMNHALRVSTTGVPVGPGLFDCLAILGKAETLRRIEMALAQDKVG